MTEHKTEDKRLDKEEYRVGCFDGSVEDGVAKITHDNIDDDIVMDIEETGDLLHLLDVLRFKSEILQSDEIDEEKVKDFEEFTRSLEA